MRTLRNYPDSLEFFPSSSHLLNFFSIFLPSSLLFQLLIPELGFVLEDLHKKVLKNSNFNIIKEKEKKTFVTYLNSDTVVQQCLFIPDLGNSEQ